MEKHASTQETVRGQNVFEWYEALISAALVLWCHRENIQRLLRGQERKFHWHTGPEK